MTVGAHPDDASVFWGGAILRHVDERWRVVSVVLSDGRRAPVSFEATEQELARRRAEEVTWESRRLGAELVHLALPDLAEDGARSRARSRLVELVLEHRPGRVITHHLDDRHATHVRTGRIALGAILEASERDASYELPEVWLADGWEPVHYPDVLLDITPFLHAKLAAISQHSSQLFDQALVTGAMGLASYRAAFAESHRVSDPGRLFAEAFRRLPLEELRAAAKGSPGLPA